MIHRAHLHRIRVIPLPHGRHIKFLLRPKVGLQASGVEWRLALQRDMVLAQWEAGAELLKNDTIRVLIRKVLHQELVVGLVDRAQAIPVIRPQVELKGMTITGI